MEKIISLRVSKNLLDKVLNKIAGKESLSKHIRRLLLDDVEANKFA